jgi:hypothetical protein
VRMWSKPLLRLQLTCQVTSCSLLYQANPSVGFKAAILGPASKP